VENFSKAKAAAAKAIQLDGALAEGHSAFAQAVFNLDWDWTTAGKEFRTALELNPNSSDIREDYAGYLIRMGRLEEAISEAQRGVELDPLSLALEIVAYCQYAARRYDQALETLRRLAELEPTAAPMYWGFTYAEKGIRGSYRKISKARGPSLRFRPYG
jgi:Tfp pilus assembly protein PilF